MEYRSGIYENRLHVYLTEPKTYNSMERLKYADEHTEERIRDCMELIETLKKYRLELTERAKQLQTMESHIRVSLTRKKNSWDNRVYYYLTKECIYSDGTSEVRENTKYTGKERHKAIKAFEDIKKEFPQWKYIKNIEKGIWE